MIFWICNNFNPCYKKCMSQVHSPPLVSKCKRIVIVINSSFGHISAIRPPKFRCLSVCNVWPCNKSNYLFSIKIQRLFCYKGHRLITKTYIHTNIQFTNLRSMFKIKRFTDRIQVVHLHKGLGSRDIARTSLEATEKVTQHCSILIRNIKH